MEQERGNGAALGAVVAVGILMAAVLAVILYTTMRPAPEMYVGRASLMLVSASGQEGQLPSRHQIDTQMENLLVLAGSNNTLIGAARTMQSVGVSSAPEDILRTVRIKRVPEDSEVISIEVRSPSPQDAKTAVDILAREIQDVHRKFTDANRGEIKIIDEAFVSPVNQRGFEHLRPASVTFAIGLAFLTGVGVGAILRKR